MHVNCVNYNSHNIFSGIFVIVKRDNIFYYLVSLNSYCTQLIKIKFLARFANTND